MLAALVQNHRRKLRTAAFEHLPTPRREAALRLAVLLRIAVRLNRSRNPAGPPPVCVEVDGNKIRLSLPSHWLDRHALTRADLDIEAERLAGAGFSLRYV